jgi:hypothetical protein
MNTCKSCKKELGFFSKRFINHEVFCSSCYKIREKEYDEKLRQEDIKEANKKDLEGINKEIIFPQPIWPIWLWVIILIPESSSLFIGALMWVAIISTININRKNKRNFGDNYGNNPRPTLKYVCKLKKNKFNLTHTQYITTIYSITIGIGFGALMQDFFILVLSSIGLGLLAIGLFWLLDEE